MKSRNGFVSNSSSSSFIIAYQGKDEKAAKEYIISGTKESMKNNPFLSTVEAMVNCLFTNVEETFSSPKEFADWEKYENQGDDTKKAIFDLLSKGMTVGIGSLSDQSEDYKSPENFLCSTKIDYVSDTFAIITEGGY
jgi:hypothetical protein